MVHPPGGGGGALPHHEKLNLAYPTVSEEQKKALELASLELERQGITTDPPKSNGK